MIFVVLSLLTFMVVLLPMWPAFAEWRRPTDVEPLAIDENDSLDPPHLAHRFAAQLRDAVAVGGRRLEGRELVIFWPSEVHEPIPLNDLERESRSSQRVWHVHGSSQLPEKLNFYGEVSATQNLDTATNGVYQALWAGGVARLAPHVAVKQWVHAREVWVSSHCNVVGRITAEACIHLADGVQFVLLHAPSVETTPDTEEVAHCLRAFRAIPKWPDDMAWDKAHLRGFSTQSLDIGPRNSWQADLVCLADLQVGADCAIRGNLKARGELRLRRGCQVVGSVFAQGPIYLEEDCVVTGVVVSEVAVYVRSRCAIGAPTQPTTVSAPHVILSSGVRVHGTVWATRQGRVVAQKEELAFAVEDDRVEGPPV